MSVSGIASYFSAAQSGIGLSNQIAQQTGANAFDLVKSKKNANGTTPQDTVQLSPAAQALMSANNASSASGASSGSSSSSSSSADTSTNSNSVTAEFMKIAKMTPAQRMREQILKSMHLTEADLAAMTPAERSDVEKKIAEMIKERLAGQTGTDGSSGASAGSTAIAATSSTTG